MRKLIPPRQKLVMFRSQTNDKNLSALPTLFFEENELSSMPNAVADIIAHLRGTSRKL